MIRDLLQKLRTLGEVKIELNTEFYLTLLAFGNGTYDLRVGLRSEHYRPLSELRTILWSHLQDKLLEVYRSRFAVHGLTLETIDHSLLLYLGGEIDEICTYLFYDFRDYKSEEDMFQAMAEEITKILVHFKVDNIKYIG